jgi:hypothetical protein
MKSEPNTPRIPINRLAQGDPLHRLVEQAYRAFDAPAPRHVPGCGCALCADRAQARMLASRARGTGRRKRCAAGSRASRRSRRGAPVSAVASRTDRAVFRFLAPRVLELVATGALPADATIARLRPVRARAHGAGGAGAGAIMPRFASLLLDRALQDPDWPLDLISTLRLLANGGWSLPRLCNRRRSTPTSRQACRGRGRRTAGAIRCFREHGRRARSRRCGRPSSRRSWSERMMNYAMAEGTSHRETDDAMRAADLLLRNF